MTRTSSVTILSRSASNNSLNTDTSIMPVPSSICTKSILPRRVIWVRMPTTMPAIWVGFLGRLQAVQRPADKARQLLLARHCRDGRRRRSRGRSSPPSACFFHPTARTVDVFRRVLVGHRRPMSNRPPWLALRSACSAKSKATPTEASSCGAPGSVAMRVEGAGRDQRLDGAAVRPCACRTRWQKSNRSLNGPPSLARARMAFDRLLAGALDRAQAVADGLRGPTGSKR